MARVRVSTTVDATNLETCRRLLGQPDSRIFDRALAALVEALEATREAAALEALPYEDDLDLAWEAPPGPPLPYDGEVPEEVLALAAERRRRSG